MARDKVEFDVIGRDAGGSKAFRQVGDAAERAGDQVEGLGKKSTAAGSAVDGLGDKTRESGREADAAGEQYQGLAVEIAAAQAAMRALAAEIDRTGNKDLAKDLNRQRAELRKLTRIKDLLPDMDKAGDEAASGFAARFAARLGPLMASVPLGPPGAAAGAALGAAAAPTIAAAISGAVVGGAGVGGVIGGVMLAARDERVKAAGSALGTFVLGDLEMRAAGFVPPVLEGIADIRAGWQAMGPDLDRIFESSRFVDPLVQGAISGGRKLAAGLADAISSAEPATDAISRGFDELGESAGEALSTMADDADEGAAAIDDLTVSVGRFIDASAQIVHAGATLKGWSEQVDIAADKGRYWVEDSSYLSGALERVGINLDLTADGFAKGSVQAEAYRQATLGTAEAADFATLKTAGMSDAEIAAADASGTYRQKLDDVNNALGNTTNQAATATVEVETLSEAIRRMAGENLTAEQANIRMEEAIIRATEAGKANNAGITANTPKALANRSALIALAEASNQNSEAIMTQTGSQELASAATERGRAKFIASAIAMGASKAEAKRLADQLFAIPEKVDTKIMVRANTQPALDSARGIVARINNMSARINVYAEPSGGFGGSAHTGFGYSTGMAEGGPVYGPGPKGVDSVLRVLAPGEHVLTAREVDGLGGHRGVMQIRAAARGEQRSATAAPATAAAGVSVDDLFRAMVRALQTVPVARLDAGRTADIYSRGG